jgi:hypothetical protein
MRRLAGRMVRKNWRTVTVHRRWRWPLVLFFVLIFVTLVWVVILIVVGILPSRWHIASTRSELPVLVVEVGQGLWCVGVQSKV